MYPGQNHNYPVDGNDEGFEDTLTMEEISRNYAVNNISFFVALLRREEDLL